MVATQLWVGFFLLIVSSCRATTTINQTATSVTRQASNQQMQYNAVISATTSTTATIYCTAVLSNDAIPSSDDVWLTNNNQRCPNGCPYSQQYSPTTTFTSNSNALSSTYFILVCFDFYDEYCNGQDTSGYPGCFMGNDYEAFDFSQGAMSGIDTDSCAFHNPCQSPRTCLDSASGATCSPCPANSIANGSYACIITITDHNSGTGGTGGTGGGGAVGCEIPGGGGFIALGSYYSQNVTCGNSTNFLLERFCVVDSTRPNATYLQAVSTACSLCATNCASCSLSNDCLQCNNISQVINAGACQDSCPTLTTILTVHGISSCQPIFLYIEQVNWAAFGILMAYLLAVLVGYVVLQVLDPEAYNASAIIVAYTLYNMGSDIALLVLLSFDSAILKPYFDAAIAFVIIPVICNAFIVFYLVTKEFQDRGVATFFEKYRLVASLATLISLMNIEAFSVLASRILGRPMFSLPLSPRALASLHLYSSITLVFQNAPMLIIQGLLLSYNSNGVPGTIVIISLIGSVIALTMGVISRVYTAILWRSGHFKDQNLSPLPATTTRDTLHSLHLPEETKTEI